MARELQTRAVELAFCKRIEGLFDALCVAIELESHDAKRDPVAPNSKKEYAKSYHFAMIALKEAMDLAGQ